MITDHKKNLEIIYDEIFKTDDTNDTNLKVSTSSCMSYVNHNTNLIKSAIMELYDVEYIIFPTNHFII